MINYYLIYISIAIPGIITFILAIFPILDIKFTELFFNKTENFIYGYNILVKLIYWSIPPITKIFINSLILLLVFQILKYKNYNTILKSWLIYLIVTVIIGPGLTVNFLLKENFYRARPSQILHFNGKKDFSPAFFISNQCQTNCSFSSGHAAMAYYFSSLAYTLASSTPLKNKSKKKFNIVYLISLIFGSLVSFSRILMGGHFLSDVTTSCVIILTINYLLFKCWKKIK